MESDWANYTKEMLEKLKTGEIKQKEYSFSQEMVDNKIPVDLPENEFIASLASEKLIFPARDQKKAKSDFLKYAKQKEKQIKEEQLAQSHVIDLAASISKATNKVIHDELVKERKNTQRKIKDSVDVSIEDTEESK